MLISYFIPEDGDSPEHPNVFSTDCAAPALTLAVLKKIFPLPGKYHFRVLKDVGPMRVWLDLVDEAKPVVAHSGDAELVLKVTRISLSTGSRTGAGQTGTQTQSQATRQPQPETQQEQPVSPRGGQGQEQTSPQPPAGKSVERRGSEKLISFDNYDDSSTTTPPLTSDSPFENSGNFFDFSTQEAPAVQQPPSPAHRSSSNNNMADFLNFPSSTSSTPSPMMNNGLQSNGMHGMGGMNRGSSGNINGMAQMNPNNMRQGQQQQQQNKSRNTMGGLDPFGSF